jgi:hypothetical protein
VKSKKTVSIRLTREQCSALSDAVADCAMEGLDKRDIAVNAEETWGPEWRSRRRAAMSAANKLARLGARQ